MKKIKGVTLVELVVSMTIFIVISVLVVGAFIMVSRMRSLTGIMREAQQKTRVALEIITRFSKQAEKISVSLDGKTVTLYYKVKTSPTAKKFEIVGGGINYYEKCEDTTLTPTNLSCNVWSAPNNLIDEVYTIDSSLSTNIFMKNAGPLYSTLKISLDGKIDGIDDNPYFNNEMKIETAIPLENLK